MTMRDKAHLRKHGWAGEIDSEEAAYIKGWLQQRADRAYHVGKDDIVLEQYAVSCCDRPLVLDSHARMYARGE